MERCLDLFRAYWDIACRRRRVARFRFNWKVVASYSNRLLLFSYREIFDAVLDSFPISSPSNIPSFPLLFFYLHLQDEYFAINQLCVYATKELKRINFPPNSKKKKKSLRNIRSMRPPTPWCTAPLHQRMVFFLNSTRYLHYSLFQSIHVSSVWKAGGTDEQGVRWNRGWRTDSARGWVGGVFV